MVTHCRILETGHKLSKENQHRLINVLRLKPSDSFVITDGKGKEFEAVLKSRETYEITSETISSREPDIEVTLYSAISKGDRFERLIEKAVEMGVRYIYPIVSERCVVKKPSEAKINRWQSIATTAMLQCGGCLLPEIMRPIDLSDVPAKSKSSIAILLHEQNLSVSIKSLSSLDKFDSFLLASGPEGGFSQMEVSKLIKLGWQPVWLGKRLFKTDTAPIIALAQLLSKSWF